MCYGPEFISEVLDHWAYERGVTLDFSRLGKPADNAFAEAFNGRLRDECLARVGSCPCRTPGRRSRPGGGTIMRPALAVPWGI
jgi:transposase InsO family protein